MHALAPVSLFRSNQLLQLKIEPITISSLKTKIKDFEISEIAALSKIKRCRSASRAIFFIDTNHHFVRLVYL
jgi:hypothetical protein